MLEKYYGSMVKSVPDSIPAPKDCIVEKTGYASLDTFGPMLTQS